MSESKMKTRNAAQRAVRTRAAIHGSTERPRLSVTISNMHVSAQIIDDETHSTLAAATTVGGKMSGSKTELATVVGKNIALAAKKKNITKVVFDRGSKKYHGRVKALADAARENGLEF